MSWAYPAMPAGSLPPSGGYTPRGTTAAVTSLGVYVNWSAGGLGAEVGPVVTVTSTVPVGSGGAVARMEVALVTVKLASGTEPKETLVAPVKPVPVMVTSAPPELGPVLGLTPVTVGVGTWAPPDATRRTPTDVEVPAGDWLALGSTVPDTAGS